MKLPTPIENLLKRLGIEPSTDSSAQARLRSELDRLKAEQKVLEETAIARCYTKLLQEAASPLSQLILQVHLAADKDSPLTAADVLVHVKRLITIFEQNDMVVIGQPGDILPFDPNVHEAAEMQVLQANTPVRVRFPGLKYGATLVRKAAVDVQETN